MKQGEIWFANLSPIEGSEQDGFRPVIIISGNLANQYAPVLICCPLTTKLKHYKGNPIIEPSSENGLKKISEVMVIQVQSLSKNRLKRQIGKAELWVIPQIKQTFGELLTF